MAQQRQIPGGPFFNEQGTTRQAQVPGRPFVNEVAAVAAAEIPMVVMAPLQPVIWANA